MLDFTSDADADCWTAPAVYFEKHKLFERSLKHFIFTWLCYPCRLADSHSLEVTNQHDASGPEKCRGPDQAL